MCTLLRPLILLLSSQTRTLVWLLCAFIIYVKRVWALDVTFNISPMSRLTHFTGNYGSQHTDEFMAWLKRSPGVSVSSKIQIVELMSKGAGKGVSKSPLKASYKF